MRTSFTSNCILTGLLAVCSLLDSSCANRPPMPKDANWDAGSGKFTWASGEVVVPAGFTYLPDWGADTFVGRFTSPDGRVVVSHDIGTTASIWARRDKATTSFTESVVDGARVWVAKREWLSGLGGRIAMYAVTFPDSGCASFYLESSEPQDSKVIESLARSFHPRSGGAKCANSEK